MATGKSLSASGHINHASSVKDHAQSSSYQSREYADVPNNAEYREPQTSDLLMGPNDNSDEDEDDEDDDDYKPENDKTYTETEYSVREGDFDLGEDEESEGEERRGEVEGEGNEGEGDDEDEGEDSDEDEDEDEEDESEDEDEDENKRVELEGSDEKVEKNHGVNASILAALKNDIEAPNTNSARSLPVSPRPDYNNEPRAKSKGSSPSSFTILLRSTSSPSPPPCAPSQSQPFPLPSYDPMTTLDPSIDLSLKGDLPLKAELESSPEPDFPSVSQMLAKTRLPASQPAKSTFEKGRARGSVHVSAVRSQDIVSSNVSKSPMAIHNVVSSPSLSAPQPRRPRPVACKVKPRALPMEPQSSSTLSHSATPGNEDGDRNKNNGKGKRRASIESSHSCEEDIPRENLRPTKRSKLELVAPVAHKHEQFWILDGNTVLEVGGVLFKLHRSRLVDQSTFFAGLLDEQDVLMDDGVVVERDEHGIVYHLSNTTPTDLEALLQLDKNPMAYYFVPPPFQVLAAILRAATRLGFNTYRAFAVKLLENAWSSSLADLTTESKSNAAEVVILARTCGVEGVLKRAFYEMVRVTGYGLGDGELDGDDIQEISRADERRLERMREHLISAWSQVAVRVDPSFKCPNQTKETSGTPGRAHILGSSSSSPRLPGCPSLSLKKDAWERRVHDTGFYEEYQFDPLCGLQTLIDIKWEEEGWCSDCVRARREAWTRMRQKTWERIGVWMGLDN
ncbi:hypothetical protein BDR03DRAFT_33196 [Suillus americanus]|nr:hypothetical protein BDR03DRAFT_33196 [Suillus americanus]